MKFTSIFVLLGLTIFGCDNAARQTSDRDNTTVNANDATDRDNTAVNTRDRSDYAKTPLDQNQNQKDIDITANIRKQVMDSNMSVNSQNVKIITEDGSVTLRGPVATADEKLKIETIARKVAGETRVDSQLEIARAN